MNNSIKTGFSDWLFATLLSIVLLVTLGANSACTSLSPSQIVAANGEAAGEAYGKVLLARHSVDGVVDPAYLAQYQPMIPKVARVMDGAITPADVHNLIAAAGKVSLTSGQSTVIAYLDGLTPTFIRANSNPLTPDGALVAAAAQQFASGLARAVGLVTGANYVPPANP